MGVHYYATLGYTPGVLLDVQRLRDRIDGIVVFHGDENAKQRKAKRAATALLTKLGVAHDFLSVDQPWNFRACFQAIARRHALQGRPAVIVNASGGTEVMNSAMTVFALLTASRCHYVDRKSLQTEILDFERLRAALKLEGRRAEFLEFVLAAGGSKPLGDVPRDLGVTPGAVSQLLADLTGKKVLAAQPAAKGRGKAVQVDGRLWPLVLLADRSE